jgi:hypothetical protein
MFKPAQTTNVDGELNWNMIFAGTKINIIFFAQCNSKSRPPHSNV